MFTFPSAITSKIAPNRLVSTSTEELEREEYGERVFFMKTRIMTGQVDLSKNEYGDAEFQWLTKEEIQGKVSKLYWSYIKNMLVDR
jgi:large subunit ribosomal protein L46